MINFHFIGECSARPCFDWNFMDAQITRVEEDKQLSKIDKKIMKTLSYHAAGRPAYHILRDLLITKADLPNKQDIEDRLDFLMRTKKIHYNKIRHTDLSSPIEYSYMLYPSYSILKEFDSFKRAMIRSAYWSGKSRQKKLTDPHIHYIIDLYRKGDKSVNEICQINSISRMTFYKYVKRYG